MVQSTQAIVEGLSVENLNRVKFKAKHEAETVAGSLVQDIKVNFDAKAKKLTFSCGLTTQTNMPNAPEVSLVAGVNSAGLPNMKGSVTFTLVKGSYKQCILASETVTFDVEVTAERDSLREQVNQVSQVSNFNWSDALGLATVVALTIGVVIIVGGTIAEDCVTAGAGIADDPASFAIAGGMLSTSGRLLATHLPRLSPRIAAGLGFTTAAPITTADNPITEE